MSDRSQRRPLPALTMIHLPQILLGLPGLLGLLGPQTVDALSAEAPVVSFEVPGALRVRIHTATGTRALPAVPGIPVVVPLTGRSTAYLPADTENGEVRLSMDVGGSGSVDSVRVEVVRHPADTVIRPTLPDFRPMWLGPARLPERVTAAGSEQNLLPELARADRNTVLAERGALRVEFGPEGPRPGELVVVTTAGAAPPGRSRWDDLVLPELAVEVLSVLRAEDLAEQALDLSGRLEAIDRVVLREPLDLGALNREPGSIVAAKRGGRFTRSCHMCMNDMMATIEDHKPLDQIAELDGDAVELDHGCGLDLVLAAPAPGPPGTTATLLVTFEGDFSVPSGRRTRGPAVEPSEPEHFRFAVHTPRTTGFPIHFEGPDEQLDIRPTMGPGVALGDADGDGHVDLYLVQGGGRESSRPASNRLWRNRGEGPLATRFEDVGERAGVGDTGWGMGSLFFDAEGDGDLDLYVANYGADVLYRNDGDGTFTDVSTSAGVGGELWSAGVCAADADLDGDLDLYVTSYLDYDESKLPAPEDLGRYRREDPIAMLPFAFPGQRNVFLRNDSWDTASGAPAEALAFTDVTDALKLADEGGRGMQAVFWDFDRDGDPDLYVANDVSYNVLFRNDTPRDGSGALRFKDVSFSTGLDDPRGGMGLAVGDTDGDGDQDLFLTNWQLEANALYTNNLLSHRSAKHRVATFRDRIVESGLGPYGVGATSWGAELFDADNDGDLDLYVANGYTSPDYETTGICVGQTDHFFENTGRGKFTRSEDAWAAGREDLPSRSVVGCDLDGDGDVDLFVTANNQRPELLENLTAPGPGSGPGSDSAHWLVVRLAGRAPNTRGIGAFVTVRARGDDGERTWSRELRAGASYLGGNPPELHFGLGELDGELTVEVRWPDGSSSEHAVGAADRRIELAQPR